MFISKIKEIREPAEKAFTGFLMDVGYPGRDNPEGIPVVSLVYHDGEDVVRLQNILLPDVDREMQERKLTGKNTLYRVDYLCGGKIGRAIGKLKTGDEAGDFLERIKNGGNVSSRDVSGSVDAVRRAEAASSAGIANSADAGVQILCFFLKKHMALCRLERLARGELFPQGQTGEEAGTGSQREDRLYRQADSAYYREVLAYVGEARRALNLQPRPILPPFPERGPFLAEWYRNHQGSGGGRQHED